MTNFTVRPLVLKALLAMVLIQYLILATLPTSHASLNLTNEFSTLYLSSAASVMFTNIHYKLRTSLYFYLTFTINYGFHKKTTLNNVNINTALNKSHMLHKCIVKHFLNKTKSKWWTTAISYKSSPMITKHLSFMSLSMPD